MICIFLGSFGVPDGADATASLLPELFTAMATAIFQALLLRGEKVLCTPCVVSTSLINIIANKA